MARKKIGKLPRRYAFMLNPYTDTRLSKCPKCKQPTHPRKFPLFIHIDQWGPLTLGKTCRYCSRCELIIVHQDELDAELEHRFSELAPKVIGNKYLVLGTVERKTWQQAIDGQDKSWKDITSHLADFKRYYDLEYQPAGWYRADDKPKK